MALLSLAAGCSSKPSAIVESSSLAKASASKDLGLPVYEAHDAITMARLNQIVYQYGDDFHPYYTDHGAYESDLTRMRQQGRDLGYEMVAYSLQGKESLLDTGEVFAAIFEHQDRYVITFRGTTFSSLPGFLNNLDWLMLKSPWGQGWIHHGFYTVEEKLWPMIDDFFSKPEHQQKPLWITGHSLGGAIATLTASKIAHKMPKLTIDKIYTYGTPRAGDPDFFQGFKSDGLEEKFIKFARYDDIVAGTPLTFLGYGDTRNIVWIGEDDTLTRVDQNYSQSAAMSFDYKVNTNAIKSLLNAQSLDAEQEKAMNAMMAAMTGDDVQKPDPEAIAGTMAEELHAIATSHDIKTYVRICSEWLGKL